MPSPTEKFDFSHFSISERLELTKVLCESLSPEDVPLTKEELQELDMLLAAEKAREVTCASEKSAC
ncbi:MAG: hypothetical protein KGJ21_08450 [Pseudomonadota bacterium]|nr:hypothetical protein [Pseudomonadota bacterium]